MKLLAPRVFLAFHDFSLAGQRTYAAHGAYLPFLACHSLTC